MSLVRTNRIVGRRFTDEDPGWHDSIRGPLFHELPSSDGSRFLTVGEKKAERKRSAGPGLSKEGIDRDGIEAFHVAGPTGMHATVLDQECPRIALPIRLFGWNRVDVTAQGDPLSGDRLRTGLAPQVFVAISTIESGDSNRGVVQIVADKVHQRLGAQIGRGVETNQAGKEL